MKNKQKIIHLIIDVLSVILLVWIDRISKNVATAKLKGQNDFVIIKDVFVLQYLENRGAAFGVFQNKQYFFIAISIIFLAIVAYVLIKLPVLKKYYVFESVLAFLAAGAIGNMIDRIIQNYVVDFFYFELIDFPIFNVADIYVTLSCIAFAIILIFVFSEEDLSFLSLKKNKNE